MQVGFFVVATHVGVLLILSTMRQRNGYRNLHRVFSEGGIASSGFPSASCARSVFA